MRSVRKLRCFKGILLDDEGKVVGRLSHSMGGIYSLEDREDGLYHIHYDIGDKGDLENWWAEGEKAREIQPNTDKRA